MGTRPLQVVEVVESTPMIWMTGDAAADELLDTDDFALLTGMLLDQQVR